MGNCIPVLSSTESVLTNAEDICKYVLDAYVRTPKGINDTFREREISITADIAQFTDNDTLADVIRANLRRVLENYFNTHQITLDVNVVASDLPTISNISISISIYSDEKVFSTSSSIQVENGQIKLR